MRLHWKSNFALLLALLVCATASRAEPIVLDFQPRGGIGNIKTASQEGFKAFGGTFCILEADEQTIFYLPLPGQLGPGEYKFYIRPGPRYGRIQLSGLEIALADDIEPLTFAYTETGNWIGPVALKPSRPTSIVEMKIAGGLCADAVAIVPQTEEFTPPDGAGIEKPLGFKLPEWAAVWIDWPDKADAPPWFVPSERPKIRIRYASAAKEPERVPITLSIYSYDQTRIAIERWNDEIQQGETFREVSIPEAFGPYLLVFNAKPPLSNRALMTQLACARISEPATPPGDERLCAHFPPDDYHIALARRIGFGGARATDEASYMLQTIARMQEGAEAVWHDAEVARFRQAGFPLLGVIATPRRTEGGAASAEDLDRWGRNARAVIERYRHIGNWEVVPGGGFDFADAEAARRAAAQSVAELRAAARAVRAANPDHRIIGLSGPSLNVPFACDFWREAFRAGALDYCDVVSARLYLPEAGSIVTDQDLSLDSYMAALKMLMQRVGGKTRPLWDTESGLFPIMSFYVDKRIRYGQALQGQLVEYPPLPAGMAASYMARLALIHLWHDVKWYVFSLNWRPGYAWTLTEQDGAPLPAAVALAQTIRLMKGAEGDGRQTLYPNIIALKFRRGDEGIAALWAVAMRQNERRVTLWPPEPLKAMDMYGNALARGEELEIGASPIYIAGPREELARALPRIVAISRFPDRFRDTSTELNLASPGRAESPVITGSSLAQGHSVAPVNDGRIHGCGGPEDAWASDNRGEEHFLTFRWAEAQAVNRCSIAWSPAHMPLQYTLRWYDGKDFRPALSDPEWRAPATPVESFYFPEVRTTMLRLVARTEPGEGMRVQECELYHVPLATPQTADERSLGQTYRPSGVGAIRNWLVCGPFPAPGVLPAHDPELSNQAANLNANVLFSASKGLIPDAQCRPDPRDRFVTLFPPMQNAPWNSRRIMVAWRQVNQETAYLDIGAAIRTPLLSESGENLAQVIGYCACYIVLREPFKGHIGVGSDDGYNLYIDGKLVASVPARRSVVMNSECHYVELDAGEHLLLLKVLNVVGDHGVYVALLKDGNPFTDFLIRLRPSGGAGR